MPSPAPNYAEEGAFFEEHNHMLRISDVEITLSGHSDLALDARLKPYTTSQIERNRHLRIDFEPQGQDPYEDLYRLVREEFPKLGRFIAHMAVIAYNGAAYAFAAPSGTGKTTHIRLWMDAFGPDVTVINGDKPLLKLGDPSASEPPVAAYGTPWGGKEGWQTNTSAPLAGLCFLSRGNVDECRRISPAMAFKPAMRQVYIPTDPRSALLTLDFLDVLLRSVPLYQLSCTMGKSAVKASFEAMTGLDFDTYAKES